MHRLIFLECECQNTAILPILNPIEAVRSYHASDASSILNPFGKTTPTPSIPYLQQTSMFYERARADYGT